jgi:hypothetical protein
MNSEVRAKLKVLPAIGVAIIVGLATIFSFTGLYD